MELRRIHMRNFVFNPLPAKPLRDIEDGHIGVHRTAEVVGNFDEALGVQEVDETVLATGRRRARAVGRWLSWQAT
jgi:hypothetical protein